MPKIVHYRDKCIGCAYCFELQPDTWRMSQKDGRATLIGGEKKKNVFVLKVSDENMDANMKTAEICPVKIIKLMV